MRKILIVDDDLSSREMLRARLEQLGHEVLEASQGEEGLLVAKQILPDLIFVDAMMPKMDGWQLCRALKTYPATQHIPLIMLTALDQNIQELRGYESGINEYLVKPWTPEIIQKAVEDWLPSLNPRKETQ